MNLARMLGSQASLSSPRGAPARRGDADRLAGPRSAGAARARGARRRRPPRRRAPGDVLPLLFEAIREGYLLHYGEPRLIDGADPDLRLLAGDYLYALGLERLAARGDLEAVRELADLISLSAQLHARGGGGEEPPRPRLSGSPRRSRSAPAVARRTRRAKQALRDGGAERPNCSPPPPPRWPRRRGIQGDAGARIRLDRLRCRAPLGPWLTRTKDKQGAPRRLDKPQPRGLLRGRVDDPPRAPSPSASRRSAGSPGAVDRAARGRLRRRAAVRGGGRPLGGGRRGRTTSAPTATARW